MSKGEKVGQAVSGALSSLLAGGSHKQRKLEATTTPEAFSGVVEQYAAAVGAAFVSILKSAP